MTIPITANAVGDIITLVELGLGAVQRLNNARGAKAEYREIQSRLESLQSLLELCETSVNSISDPDHKSTVMVHIDHARTKLNTALQLLPSYKCLATGTVASPVSTIRSIRSRVRDASKSLSWELRQSANARACLGKLSESIQTIHLAITAAHGADANIYFRSMSSTIASATAVTIAMQTDMSTTRSLVESIDARLSSGHDAVSFRAAGGSELQTTLRQTVVDEMTGLREELSLQTHQTQQYHRGAAGAFDGLAQQLADIQRAVDALNHAQQRPGMSSGASALDHYVSLSRVSLSTTTLVQISQAVVPSNELVSGGCIGSFLVLALSAPRSTDQAAYLFCACLLFISTRMCRMYQSPVVVHVVIIVDLFGDELQLPLHEAKSANQLHVALQRQFQPGKLGFKLTQSRMYDLAITDDEAVLGSILPDSWMNLLRPGQKLIMNARILDTVNRNELTCPACHTRSPSPEEPTSQGRWIKCSRCPARFECSLRETVGEHISTNPETNHSVGGGSRQDTASQNAETDVPVSESLSGTTIEEELAHCKRISIHRLSVTRGLNPLLAAGPLLWHLRFPPTSIKIRLTHLSTPGPLTHTHRSLPTSSSAPLQSLILPLPGQPIRISVMGSGTLGEMLDALYEALRVGSSRRQWGSLDEQGQRRVARAYRVRCGPDAGELARGVRRVDLLGEGAAFAGLGRAQNGEWMLRVVNN